MNKRIIGGCAGLILIALSNSAYSQGSDIHYVDAVNTTVHGELPITWYTFSPTGYFTEDQSFDIWFNNADATVRLETYGKDIVGAEVALNQRDNTVTPLDAGDEIGPASAWVAPRICADQCQPIIASTDYLDWHGETAYVGMQMSIQGSVYYGWIRIEVAENGDAATLLDYGYKLLPGVSIAAGDRGTTVPGMSMTFGTSAICMSLTNEGNLGYLSDGLDGDKPRNNCEQPSPESMGVGFNFNGEKLLYEGGLLIGTGPDQVLNSIRSTLASPRIQDRDFSQKPGTQTRFVSKGTMQFSKVELIESDVRSPIGITVIQESWGTSTPDNEDFIILKYTVRNDSPINIEGLYVALFVDWDVTEDIDNNQSGYDEGRNIGWVTAPVQGADYVGIRLLTELNKQIYYMIDNESEMSTLNNDLGFWDEEKWLIMSGANGDRKYLSGLDVSQLVSAGPFDLTVGGAKSIGFAMVAGEDYGDFVTNADNALALYPTLETLATESVSLVPETFTAGSVYPHPVTFPATFDFDLNEPATVVLDIVDMLGRSVGTLLNGRWGAGSHSVTLSAPRLPLAGGVYNFRWSVQHPSRSLTGAKLIVVQ